jgi:hypothetical protein
MNNTNLINDLSCPISLELLEDPISGIYKNLNKFHVVERLFQECH